MRIISQNKRIDIPYELYTIYYEYKQGNYIVYGLYLNSKIALGNYKENEVIKVMEDIQRKYQFGAKLFEMPISEGEK